MNACIAKCGCNCATCPTYKDNVQNIEQRKACSSGWERYLNIKLSPEKLRACDGCSLPDSERNTYYLNCKVRKCCIENGMDNCAYCSIFPCRELESVHSMQLIQSKEDFTSLTGKDINEADFVKFIEPYAGLQHLNEIRKNLSKSEIKDYKEFTLKNKSSKLPADLSLNDDNGGHGLKRIYNLLTSLAIRSNVSYAEYMTLRAKREQLLKMLMAFGIFGIIVKAGSDSLELDGEVYLAQKLPGMYHKLLEYLDELKQYHISGEIIVLDPKTWQTPTGGLRRKGWKIRISFGDSSPDSADLRVFKNYMMKLHQKYGKNTYRYFNIADLTVMKRS